MIGEASQATRTSGGRTGVSSFVEIRCSGRNTCLGETATGGVLYAISRRCHASACLISMTVGILAHTYYNLILYQPSPKRKLPFSTLFPTTSYTNVHDDPHVPDYFGCACNTSNKLKQSDLLTSKRSNIERVGEEGNGKYYSERSTDRSTS